MKYSNGSKELVHFLVDGFGAEIEGASEFGSGEDAHTVITLRSSDVKDDRCAELVFGAPVSAILDASDVGLNIIHRLDGEGQFMIAGFTYSDEVQLQGRVCGYLASNWS